MAATQRRTGSNPPPSSYQAQQRCRFGNGYEYFDLPEDSPKHTMLREDGWIGGAGHECRYYLGALTGRNEFRSSVEDFLDHLAEYIVSKTSKGAEVFCIGMYHCQFVVDFLRRTYERDRGRPPLRKNTKEHLAIDTLLRHPDWTNEQIAAKVGATMKTVKRWSKFNAARAAQKHYRDRVEGYYRPLRFS